MLKVFFYFKQKTAYEMLISDWSSDVCSSDLNAQATHRVLRNPVTPPSDAPDYTRPGPRIATQTPCRLQVVPHPANTKIWAGSIWILTRAPRCGRYTPGTRACRCPSLPGREGEVAVMCTRLVRPSRRAGSPTPPGEPANSGPPGWADVKGGGGGK